MSRCIFSPWATSAPWLPAVLALAATGASAAHDEYLAGYLIISHADEVDRSFNAGFSMYVAAWPLLRPYPGHRFQSGLPSTWMFAQYDGPAPEGPVLRRGGGPRLVEGHALPHRDAQIHHGRCGPPTSPRSPTGRPTAGERGTSPGASTGSPNSARGCSSPSMA
jgi:hypothetical protein